MKLYHVVHIGYGFNPDDYWVSYTGLTKEDCIEYIRNDDLTFEEMFEYFYDDLIDKFPDITDEELENKVRNKIKDIDANRLFQILNDIIRETNVPWTVTMEDK